eukprot:3941732-Rhodomonas_salina.3
MKYNHSPRAVPGMYHARRPIAYLGTLYGDGVRRTVGGRYPHAEASQPRSRQLPYAISVPDIASHTLSQYRTSQGTPVFQYGPLQRSALLPEIARRLAYMAALPA